MPLLQQMCSHVELRVETDRRPRLQTLPGVVELAHRGHRVPFCRQLATACLRVRLMRPQRLGGAEVSSVIGEHFRVCLRDWGGILGRYREEHASDLQVEGLRPRSGRVLHFEKHLRAALDHAAPRLHLDFPLERGGGAEVPLELEGLCGVRGEGDEAPSQRECRQRAKWQPHTGEHKGASAGGLQLRGGKVTVPGPGAGHGLALLRQVLEGTLRGGVVAAPDKLYNLCGPRADCCDRDVHLVDHHLHGLEAPLDVGHAEGRYHPLRVHALQHLEPVVGGLQVLYWAHVHNVVQRLRADVAQLVHLHGGLRLADGDGLEVVLLGVEAQQAGVLL
mmetsp:Transcript_24923/g.41686  ORF Transcript_24923/g.41686 Transcript_24923/m.41686 type:complete len:333 (-) Transcript_24923:765-1763(-)